MKIHDFQAKWPMLQLVWKDSFPKWSHILHMCVYYTSQQVCQRKFLFALHENSIFHFPSDKNGVFCEGSTKYLMSTWTTIFLSNTRPYFIYNWPKFPCNMVFIYLFWKRQISADSVGTRSNLNYMCLIVCSLFFEKIISRYTSSHFIRDPPRLL